MTNRLKFQTTLGRITSNITSGSRGWAEYYSDSGALFLRMTNLPKEGIGLLLHDRTYVRLSSVSSEGKRTRVMKNDILISITAELGKIGFVEDDLGEAYVNQHVALVRLSSKEVNPKFVAYYLSETHQRNLWQRLNDAGAKAGLNLQTINNYPLSLLPLAEQGAIANLLSTWDQAIEKTERLLAGKKKLLSALYQQCFQPGTSVNRSWRSEKISKYLKPRNDKALPSEENPLYSLTIEDGVTAKTERYNRDFLVKDTDSKTYKVVHPGDIVFNPANLRWGAIARSEIKHKVVISPIYEVLEIRKGVVDPEFLIHALTCSRQIGIFATKTEGTLIERMAVKLNAFLLTEILVPATIEEQNKFSMLLDTAKKEIYLLKKQVESYRKQKRGLMQKLLTGQWQIRISGGA